MAKNTEFLDTNCMLRYVLGDNLSQAKKVEDLVSRGATIQDCAFLEFVWVLQSFYEMSREQVTQKIEVFTMDERVSCNQEVLSRASSHYLQYPQISFIDAYLAVMAGKKGGILRTFDKNLSKKLPNLAKIIN
jgi:predicted nucleic-acid-binding protein